MELTLEMVKEFLDENKESEEVKSYLQDFKKLTVDEISELTSTNSELAAWLDSEKDKHHSTALNTFKKKTMPKLFEEKLKEMNPQKDEKDLAIEKMQAQINKMQQEKLKESLKGSAYKFASENDLPQDLIDYFISIQSDDAESNMSAEELSQQTTNENLEKFKEVWQSKMQSLIEERLSSSSHNPKDITSPNNTMDVTDPNISFDEYKKIRMQQQN
ncbi:DUF4355 domain-containing protein [Bacillus inaquosorum]|uniref:DUF4355 domain-containing protein n=1 Tax=Bacillus inaquosorum TaxID=483913 RepID=UPI00227DC8B6|nr:DUF4355 domain-containing protein [Bacillus inaquosorum]MCY9096363.1 DUF4355 domain-containing protein [Bacillus inaquosorum]